MTDVRVAGFGGAVRASDPLVLVAQGVTRFYGGDDAPQVRALAGVDLEVRVGELVAVMGPSGSGKSTLLRILGGLDLPTAGLVKVEGFRLPSLTQREMAFVRRRHIGYVFQELNLLPTLTAVENVALPRELDGVPVRQARAEGADLLARVGLAGLEARLPDQLSGGQQQRVAIARAMVGPRRLLLADEPTGALDAATGREVLQLLRDTCDDGVAGVFVTHDEDHAGWADRVVHLADGLVRHVTLAGR